MTRKSSAESCSAPTRRVPILELAGADIDLLFLGSRAYGPMRRAVVGSVSTRGRAPRAVSGARHAAPRRDRRLIHRWVTFPDSYTEVAASPSPTWARGARLGQRPHDRVRRRRSCPAPGDVEQFEVTGAER